MRYPIEVRATPSHPLGMPTARFLRDHWQRRPLLVRAAAAGFRDPLSPEDLAGLACEESALSRIVIQDPRRDRWTLRTGPFSDEAFASLPPSHWTLLVQDVDKWDADVAALLDAFDFLPAWRVDDVMVSYAEEGGSVGAHVDQYDVFLMQGLGRRRWRISTDATAPRDVRDDAELKLLREFAPTHEWTLAAGDMLYLPPGLPHHGVAVGGPCMTYSIGMRAPSQADLAGDFVDHLVERMADESRYTDAGLAPAKRCGEIDEGAFARVLASMPWLRLATSTARGKSGGSGPQGAGEPDPARVDAAELRRWFGGFITRYRSAPLTAAAGPRLTDAALEAAMDRDALVQRNPWSRFAWTREGRGAVLFVSGEAHDCSARFAERVNRRPPFALSSMPANRRDRAVLRGLIDAGHLAIVKPPRRRRSP